MTTDIIGLNGQLPKPRVFVRLIRTCPLFRVKSNDNVTGAVLALRLRFSYTCHWCSPSGGLDRIQSNHTKGSAIVQSGAGTSPVKHIILRLCRKTRGFPAIGAAGGRVKAAVAFGRWWASRSAFWRAAFSAASSRLSSWVCFFLILTDSVVFDFRHARVGFWTDFW